ncbi:MULTISPECIES: glycoside hydrolase family 32 protein [Metabacillus]|uniref:Glycoside hydrolase n=2 Tax=Metabacillus TaxID=2675233 RepID=A0A179T795_9BACI|nr:MULTISPECIES: glycoside hydrolase family 32 protein [Metabacillus]OAS89250.1 glycoside hydrolase [Metabacillus litoralis]QNF28763.1 glycoside hydrolase family 32 protein [Metabacillus sp. KUDC1714]
MNNIEIKQKYYTERYRPQFHFSPEANWMNDPNGMVYYDGEYHLFYQYHPNGTTWGPMHWGHAVSKDLVHWEHLPIALKPDENGTIFSGSAVVDWNDTSGFFNGKSGLVAIFTHADLYPESERPRQRQSIAYSQDNGRTWMKYEGNPVLVDETITDFRDPKVFWHKETNQWVMILASGQSVRLYTSEDLKTWDFASEFGDGHGSHEGVWECPDLFELEIDGDQNNKKWVLFLSIGDDPTYEEGSRTQYFIGDFDGKTFTNIHSPETILWIDRGRDNYAGVSWSDVPNEDGRRIYVGWMSNWRYANVTPTKEWRSAMTIPRVLSLKTLEDGVCLVQTPVKELQTIRENPITITNKTIRPNDNLLSDIKGNAFEIVVEFELGGADEFGFKVCKSDSAETIIGYHVEQKKLFLDRTKSGDSSFNDSFAGIHDGELVPKDNKINLHIFVDWSSVEVFGNDGELVLTDLIFPNENSQDLELYAKGGNVKINSLELYTLRSTWSK